MVLYARIVVKSMCVAMVTEKTVPRSICVQNAGSPSLPAQTPLPPEASGDMEEVYRLHGERAAYPQGS